MLEHLKKAQPTTLMRNRPNLSSARVLAAGSSLEAWQVDPSAAADLSPMLLDEHGRLKAVPASELERTTAHARLRFGVTHGIYGLLTHELITFLRQFIAGRTAIEIGAGHGQLAAAIDIPATDNKQQEDPEVQAHYAALGQPTVRYGDHVHKLDALAAVQVHRPQVVIASWVTHLYKPESPDAGGSVSGIDEEALIRSCETYVLIGNTHVHRNKSIWSLPHELLTPPWLYSRAINGTPDFIAIWRRPPA